MSDWGRKRTATPGVFQNHNRITVAVVKKGKRLWHSFDTYEEAVLFKERHGRRRAKVKAAPSPPPNVQAGWIYFVQQGSIGPIKVGWAEDNVEARVTALQVGNPEQLNLIGMHYAARLYENAAHHHFRDQRLRGEWFQPTPELIAWAINGPDEHGQRWLRERPESVANGLTG